MKTVNEIIAEINHCNYIITALEDYNRGLKKFEGNCDELGDAIDIIERYIRELGDKQVK